MLCSYAVPKIYIDALMSNLLNRCTISITWKLTIKGDYVVSSVFGHISSHVQTRNERSSSYLALCIDVGNFSHNKETALDLDAISFFAQALEIWAMTYQFV
jgi:hypothetical protein